jgi:hypothetical protein
MKDFTKLDAAGLPLSADATDHVAVLDNTTGLIWSKGYVGSKPLNWKQAAKACEKFDLCGQPGRLPTVDELFALPDRTRFNPAIDTNYFPGTTSDACWSSTPDASSPGDYAWIVNFNDGHAYYHLQGGTALARAVRSSRASQ